MSIRIIKESNETVNQLIREIKDWNSKGYECWVEGLGDGRVRLVCEKNEYSK